MTPVVRTGAIGASIVVAAAIAMMVIFQGGASAQTGSTLPYKLFAPNLASDGRAGTNPGGEVPPPDPSYCPGQVGGGVPPEAAFGLITIGGQPAPAGTLVQMTFDGKVGPGFRVDEAGGYGPIFYVQGSGSCSNKGGAAIGFLVNGQPITTTAKLGTESHPFVFTITVP